MGEEPSGKRPCGDNRHHQSQQLQTAAIQNALLQAYVSQLEQGQILASNASQRLNPSAAFGPLAALSQQISAVSQASSQNSALCGVDLNGLSQLSTAASLFSQGSSGSQNSNNGAPAASQEVAQQSQPQMNNNNIQLPTGNILNALQGVNQFSGLNNAAALNMLGLGGAAVLNMLALGGGAALMQPAQALPAAQGGIGAQGLQFLLQQNGNLAPGNINLAQLLNKNGVPKAPDDAGGNGIGAAPRDAAGNGNQINNALLAENRDEGHNAAGPAAANNGVVVAAAANNNGATPGNDAAAPAVAAPEVIVLNTPAATPDAEVAPPVAPVEQPAGVGRAVAAGGNAAAAPARDAEQDAGQIIAAANGNVGWDVDDLLGDNGAANGNANVVVAVPRNVPGHNFSQAGGADDVVGQAAFDAAVQLGTPIYDTKTFDFRVHGRAHPLCPLFTPCPGPIRREEMSLEERHPGRFGQLNVSYAVMMIRAFNDQNCAMLNRCDCWFAHGRNSFRMLKTASFVAANAGVFPVTNMRQMSLEYRNLCAQLHITFALDLPLDPEPGRHRMDHQDTMAIRKILSLRVRGRAVDQRMVRNATAGLAKIPPQVRNDTAYPSPTLDLIEKVARYYEGQDVVEDSTGL
eukprot:g14373.t1